MAVATVAEHVEATDALIRRVRDLVTAQRIAAYLLVMENAGLVLGDDDRARIERAVLTGELD